MTSPRRRWTDNLDANLRRLGRTKSVLLVAVTVVIGAALAAFVLATIAQIAAGELSWFGMVGSGKRSLPTLLVVSVGGPVAMLCAFYGVSVAVRLVRRWSDVPSRGSR